MENVTEATAPVLWEMSKDALAPQIARRPIRGWERAPVPAHTSHRKGRKLWKKLATPLGGVADDLAEVQTELESEGAGQRKKPRPMGAKENITIANWLPTVADTVSGEKLDITTTSTSLALTDVTNVQASPRPTSASHKQSYDLTKEELQFVPRKRTNSNRVITPRKPGVQSGHQRNKRQSLLKPLQEETGKRPRKSLRMSMSKRLLESSLKEGSATSFSQTCITPVKTAKVDSENEKSESHKKLQLDQSTYTVEGSSGDAVHASEKTIKSKKTRGSVRFSVSAEENEAQKPSYPTTPVPHKLTARHSSQMRLDSSPMTKLNKQLIAHLDSAVDTQPKVPQEIQAQPFENDSTESSLSSMSSNFDDFVLSPIKVLRVSTDESSANDGKTRPGEPSSSFPITSIIKAEDLVSLDTNALEVAKSNDTRTTKEHENVLNHEVPSEIEVTSRLDTTIEPATVEPKITTEPEGAIEPVEAPELESAVEVQNTLVPNSLEPDTVVESEKADQIGQHASTRQDDTEASDHERTDDCVMNEAAETSVEPSTSVISPDIKDVSILLSAEDSQLQAEVEQEKVRVSIPVAPKEASSFVDSETAASKSEEALENGETTEVVTYDHDDTDMLRNFLTRVQAKKAAKLTSPKRKRSLPHSPLRIPLGEMENNLSPISSQQEGEFDLAPLSPSKRKKRTRQTEIAEDVNEPKSPRRSTRTRLPLTTGNPLTAPSLIPMRRLGQEDSTVTLKKSEEKELALLTRVNTRKNKAGSVPAVEVLAKKAEDSDSLMTRQRLLTEVFETASQGTRKSKRKNVTWAKELAKFQMMASIKENEAKEKSSTAQGVEEKKQSAVRVGVRSKLALGMAMNGTPAPKRNARGRL